MDTMNISFSPALDMTSLQAHSGAINNIEQSSIAVVHAVSVIETHKLLLEVYRTAWHFVQQYQYSNQMSHKGAFSSPGAMTDGGNDPEPPAAPPIIILAQSSKAPAPHFQVPDPADPPFQPHPPTSSLSYCNHPIHLSTARANLLTTYLLILRYLTIRTTHLHLSHPLNIQHSTQWVPKSAKSKNAPQMANSNPAKSASTRSK
ncbi:hypothetical protein J4E91_002894 [Alternaria rosae]|nr:hypothetical protein J4E91_002894 [Alternaria rosae]